jgi:uncharacterized protein (DUF2225 family)
MDNLFKDIEGLGVKNLDKLDLYKTQPKKNEVPSDEGVASDVLYMRKTVCPVCDRHFENPTVRVGRVRFIDSELDLRPRYSGFDPILYDVIACPSCGYAALKKFYDKVSDAKIRQVKEQISVNYKGKTYAKVFDYKTAIERYKLAIVCGAVGYDPSGRKAYLCLKTAWLYRSWAETVLTDEKLAKELKTYEFNFLKQAIEGFLIAYENESFPVMGIDQGTMEYLLGELFRRTGKKKEARFWISRVMQRPGTSKRLNDKIIRVKALLKESN